MLAPCALLLLVATPRGHEQHRPLLRRAPVGAATMTLPSALRKTLLWVLALTLLWLVLIRGYADYLARPLPARALLLNAQQPEALIKTAEAALIARQMDEAERLAQLVLRKQPLEGRALRILAAVAEARGNRPRALLLMHAAAAASPRDTLAQFWLALNALADRDLNAALQRLDRLLRFQPELADDVFPILATIALNPVGSRALAKWLAVDPNWRFDFLRRLIIESPSSSDINRLLRAIVLAGGVVHEAELEVLAARLLRTRNWPALRKLVTSASVGSEDTALLYDGAFDEVLRNRLRGWVIARVAGADVLISKEPVADNNSLRLLFYDRRVAFKHVSQILLLTPGHYRLSGRARLIDLRAAQGLTWTLSCAESEVLLGKTERFVGTSDWRYFEVGFSVLSADCGAQQLRLVLDARIAAEQQVSGEAWFDDLAVELQAPIESVPEAGNAQQGADSA